MKLIKIEVQKKYLWPARGIFFLAFLYFANKVIDIWLLGEVHSRHNIVYIKGIHNGFYIQVLYYLLLALLNYWLATLGTVVKKSET